MSLKVGFPGTCFITVNIDWALNGLHDKEFC